MSIGFDTVQATPQPREEWLKRIEWLRIEDILYFRLEGDYWRLYQDEEESMTDGQKYATQIVLSELVGGEETFEKWFNEELEDSTDADI